MCASYLALPSVSVSTRTIVPPGTSASAASLTFAAVSPVSRVSSLRWPPHGAGAVVAAVDEFEPEPPLAAFAIP
jgi:hypothetical protein